MEYARARAVAHSTARVNSIQGKKKNQNSFDSTHSESVENRATRTGGDVPGMSERSKGLNTAAGKRPNHHWLPV
jgi:hypothetical protein